ncbi:MAG: diguanylate cyclase [Aquificae bacterium]|nr:diguanylate cyclase [Aquificota bacterium]
MTSSPLVKELMVCNPIVIDPESTVRKAIEMMETHGVGSVIVVEKFTRKPLNIITHKDVISAIYHSMLDSPISELIELLEKKELITIREEDTVIDAIRIFEEKGIEHLPVINAEGVLVGIITGTDILKGLPRFALIDPLTGLENRRVLDYLSQKLKRQRVRDLYVLFIDVDNFKRINDTYGHVFGDQVLRRLAQEILASVRAYDNVIRFGGEEIVVILHRVNYSQAMDIAQRIRKRVKSITFEEHPEVRITVSVGVAPYTGDLLETIKRADEAMYKAKKVGRDTVVSVK